MAKVSPALANDAIRASYFASLFDKPVSIIVGGIIQIFAMMIAQFNSGSPIYAVLGFGVVACSLWRYWSATRYNRLKPDLNDPVVVARWEREHLIGLVAGSLLVGAFGFTGVYLASTDLTVIASTIIVMGSGTSVLGKYYGSARQTNLALCCLTLPYVGGLFANDDMLHALMGLLSLPFVWMMSSLSGTLRNTLFESARGRTLVAEIADRFNAALNNMPHGLLMIDDANRIEVANRQLFKLLQLSPDNAIEGRMLDVVFTLARRQGFFATREQADQASQKTAMLVAREGGGSIILPMDDEKALQITAKKRSKGGAVLLIEDISARLAAENRIARMARFDELTNLQNRAYFKENVDELLAPSAAGKGQFSALYAIDVDEFKGINDTYGHLIGDELLVKLGGSLSRLARKNVLVSRFGGDEFAVFASGLASHQAAEALAKRIAAALNQSYELTGCRYTASVSIGYALTDSEAQDFQALMIRADLALYARKNDKSVPFRAYEAELDRRQRERLQLKSDLGAAIRERKLHLVYQPVVDIDRLRMTSCEALVRWNHPTLGAVSPASFVPLAEEMGIVGDMTRFVLHEACKACAKWPMPISVSVNLSAIDFDRPGLVAEIKSALSISGLQPSRLEVEITETAAIKSKARVLVVLAELRAFGVRVALDDFGVGYSGLSHLHSLPLDRVKIDRSFILAINDNDRSLKLLSAIIDMARVLDLAITVEGIEDMATLERVIAAGPVEKVQGFVFGRHLNASQIADLANHIYARPTAKIEGDAALLQCA
jgi:diguanylate cyclase (GGDEF)-like protein